MKKVGTGKPAEARAATKRLLRALSLFLFLPAARCLLPASVQAAVPVKITYQGNIRQSGNLVTGQRNIVFRIYPSSVSATALWTSSVYPVSISTGVFKVDLAPAISDWESGSLWLELEIEGVRLSPRDELTSAPYSVNSLLHSGKRYSTAATAPSSPALGDLWLDSSAGLLRYWNGTVWTTGGTGGGMPDQHAYTHAGTGFDPITSIGTHSVTGPLYLDGGADLRAGAGAAAVQVSTDLYIVGFSSAARYYGDGSALTGISGDNLGNHIAAQDLRMGVYQVSGLGAVTMSSYTASGALGVGAAKLRFNPNVELSSTTAANYGGVYASSHVYVNGDLRAAKIYGDVSGASGLPSVAGDNLGTHVATQTLNMAGFGIVSASSITANYQITTYSTMTVAGGAFSVGGSTLTVSQGKVGIGVAAPARPLEVKNSGTTFKVDTASGYGSLYIDGVEMVRMRP